MAVDAYSKVGKKDPFPEPEMGLYENNFSVRIHTAFCTGIAPKTAEIMRQQPEAETIENSRRRGRFRRNLRL